MIGVFNFFETIKPFIFLIWVLLQIMFGYDIFLNKGKYTVKLIDLFDNANKDYESDFNSEYDVNLDSN